MYLSLVCELREGKCSKSRAIIASIHIMLTVNLVGSVFHPIGNIRHITKRPYSRTVATLSGPFVCIL